MSRIIDADSHFMEPLDLWEQYIEPKYRSRCLRFEREADGNYAMLLDGKRTTGLGKFTNRELLGVAVGYGQKEELLNLTSCVPAAIFRHSLEDMDKRIAFLDEEGIESQFIYPTLGLFWEDGVADPDLAAAHCRAYNTWALEMCAGHRDRFYPVGHVSLAIQPKLQKRFDVWQKMAHGRSSLQRCRSAARA